ncbi:MAG: hypothetical protein K0Q87_3436 [Neobacillus sp.]|jgi:hypothetical protein|nr:hypothetical protein [Neobacillus sp.]
MIYLKAINIKTSEERIFTLNDLYGYEGEVQGIFLKGKDGEKSWHISFNSGYRMGGMNPDFKIEILGSQERN